MRKRVRESLTPDPRLHFLPEPVLYGKQNKGLLRGTLISDRHGHTYYKIIHKTVADTEIPAVTEQLVKEGPKKGLYLQGAFKDPQLFKNWSSLLETLRAAPHRNVLHVLEWQRHPLAAAGRPPLYHIYTPVCVGSTLANILETAQRKHQPLWYRNFPVLRRHFLHGAWQGLRHPNDTPGLLHYDLKPANIFVHQDSADSPPHAELGDIDGVVQRNACLRRGAPDWHRMLRQPLPQLRLAGGCGTHGAVHVSGCVESAAHQPPRLHRPRTAALRLMVHTSSQPAAGAAAPSLTRRVLGLGAPYRTHTRMVRCPQRPGETRCPNAHPVVHALCRPATA